MKLLIPIVILTILTIISAFTITSCQYAHYHREMSNNKVMNNCKEPNVLVYDVHGYMVCVPSIK